MAEPAPLPPGHFGLPFLGELPAFVKDGFGFVEDRARRHGPIFKTRILGRPTAVITGPDATGKFIDPACVQREGSMPFHIQTLFAGRSLPLLDGEEHRERKHFVMAAFSREALAAYTPAMQRLCAGYIRRWTEAGEITWLEPFKSLSLEAICSTIMGLPAGPVLDAIARDYAVVGTGFAALPIPLPGAAYSRAKSALGRILAVYEKNIGEHLARPREDGLSRILGVRSADGRSISVAHAKMELHHIVVAGLIVWAWLVSTAVELDRHPAVRARLLEEIRQAPATLTLEALESLPFLGQVTMEIRRVSPVVQVFFGKARETFEFAGHRIPQGWMVLWGIRVSHQAPEIYADPLRFDPDRFSPARAEHCRHAHAYAPNGAGDVFASHKCAGYEYAPLFLRVFIVELLRGCAWSFTPGQDTSLDWSQIPPAPRSGLRVRVTAAPSR